MHDFIGSERENPVTRVAGRASKRALFQTYQRTTFTDALRAATSLQQHGVYEPVFLVCRGKRSLVEPQMQECARRGIYCLTEEEALTGPAPWSVGKCGSDAPRHVVRAARTVLTDEVVASQRTPLRLKLRQRAEILLVILFRVLGEER